MTKHASPVQQPSLLAQPTGPKLNPEQKLAVETIDGPVMIIAGPGTGKTTVLSERVAHILQVTDTKSNAILAITYTEAGVVAMRQKLLQRIGTDAYQVEISTIHGFCNSVLQQYPNFFPEMATAIPLNDLERLQLILQLLDKGSYPNLKPLRAPELYLREISSSISLLKREGVTPQRLLELIDEERDKLKTIRKYTRNKTLTREYQSQSNLVKRLRELQKIYQQYQEQLPLRQRYDYEDMIGTVNQKIQANSELKLSLQERFQYFLVDEYQDTNNAQNNLIFALADYWGEDANIFVVGDDAQSIFRFQGASLANFYSFHERYPQATVITLKENYRSAQLILDASYAVIQKNLGGLEELLPNVNKALHAATSISNQLICIQDCPSGLTEALDLAGQLQAKHQAGTPWEEMAIIIRQHRDFDFIRDILLRSRIPYVKPAGENALRNSYVRQLLDVLRLVETVATSPNDDVLMFTALHYDFVKVSRLDVLKLTRLAAKNKLNFWETIQLAEDFKGESVEVPSAKGLAGVRKFMEQLNEWYSISKNVPLAKLFEVVLNESGLLDYVLQQPDKYDHLNALQSLFEEVRALNETQHDLELAAFLNDIAVMERYGLTIREKTLHGRIPGVNILTAHGAKGLEFDYVFMPKCTDRNWGNRTNRDLLKMPSGIIGQHNVGKQEKNEEERRLFFVALTRARKGLYLSSAAEYADRFGKTQAAQASQFISEIPAQLTEVKKEVSQGTKETNELEMLLRQPPHGRFYLNKIDSKQFLLSLVHRLSLSPTSLNTYLECPYRFLLDNLLRVPRIPDPALAFGTAIHKGLEVYMRAYLHNKQAPEPEVALVAFRQSLGQQLLRTAQLTAYQENGEKALKAYLQHYQATVVPPLFIEYNGGGQPRLYRGVRLTGKIDKLEPVKAGSKFLNIVDYKTGRPKTRKQILGEDAEGKRLLTTGRKNYNQLLFYKVLSDLDPWFGLKGYTIVSGTLDFVEGDKQDRFGRETFEYKDTEVNDFKELIITTWEKIAHLEFSRTDQLEYCRHCPWAVHCGREEA